MDFLNLCDLHYINELIRVSLICAKNHHATKKSYILDNSLLLIKMN